MKSAFLKLTKSDFLKALFLGALALFLQSITDIFNQNRFPTYEEFQQAVIIAGKFIGAYLLKNAVTNSKGQLLKPEN